ncbi:unnamed protein product [Cunninghamella echinulata]
MAHDLKQQQIAFLFAHNESVNVIIEGQQYEITITTTGENQNENTMDLLVNLPEGFPEEAPVITISPIGMRHPWINSNVVVNEPLNTWNFQSSLGMLVHDICDEFNKRPPAKKTTNTEKSYSNRPPPPIPTSNISSSAQLNNNPEYTAILNKTPAEIEELLSNEVAFDIFFNSLDRIKNMKIVQEELMNGNENLAHKNLSQEDVLTKLQAEVKDLNVQYQQQKELSKEKERQQQEAFKRFSSSTILTRLKAGVMESDDLSESVAQSFLEGNLDHDSFVKQFREFRKVYHLRASKLERIQKDNSIFPC